MPETVGSKRIFKRSLKILKKDALIKIFVIKGGVVVLIVFIVSAYLRRKNQFNSFA